MKNQTLMQFFEWDLPADALLWKRCMAQAARLGDAGITALWLPPAYKGHQGANDVGYGVYDIYDLGEFDQKGSICTKYGTKDEYLKAVRTLQKQGIEVYADVVLNHMMGADGCETVNAVRNADNNRQETVSGTESILAWTHFSFPGRNGRYSDFCWNSSHFSGTDWDESYKRKSLFLFEGKSWSRDTDEERGNYDYLMGADLDFNNPEVTAHLTEWGKWYLSTVKPNGFRLDAVKHIDCDFYREWLKELRKASGQKLFAVGEYWHSDLKRLTRYLDRVENTMSLFDVPLHFNFFNASNQGGTFDMRYLFANSLVSVRPQNAVTFVDNHDTQPGQALVSYVAEWFRPLAYASVLLREGGVPCVFYGDYYGLPSRHIDPMPELKKLIKIRELYAYGQQTDYFDHENIVGWVREGDNEHEDSALAVLLSDGPGGSKRMCMGRHLSGAVFYDAIGRCTQPVMIGEDGWGEFGVDGGSVSVWVTKEAYEYLETFLE